jgi:hypothetical protein
LIIGYLLKIIEIVNTILVGERIRLSLSGYWIVAIKSENTVKKWKLPRMAIPPPAFVRARNSGFIEPKRRLSAAEFPLSQ